MTAPRLVRPETAQTFEAVYEGGYDKMYPSVDLVRLERWYFGGVPGKSMDYGCGPGTNGLHLLDSGYDVTFCDVAQAALKKVEEKLASRPEDSRSRAVVRHIDLESDSIPDGDQLYDYIVCMSVLGNLENRESVSQLLEEFHRILKPGGKVIVDINAPDTTYVHDSSGKVDTNSYLTVPRKGFESDEIVMYFPDSEEGFISMVEDAGFTIDDVGHMSFSYQDHVGFEYIVCAHRPE